MVYTPRIHGRIHKKTNRISTSKLYCLGQNITQPVKTLHCINNRLPSKPISNSRTLPITHSQHTLNGLNLQKPTRSPTSAYHKIKTSQGNRAITKIREINSSFKTTRLGLPKKTSNSKYPIQL